MRSLHIEPEWTLEANLCLVAMMMAAVVAPSEGKAQQPPWIELRPPDAVAGVQFTRITSIRELSDGRVLVADRAEERLVMVEWASAEGTTIARTGNGPGEYRGIGWLYPLPGDSTLFTDSYNSRWNLIHGEQIVETLSELRPVNRLLGARLYGVDRLGHALGIREGGASGGLSFRLSADSLMLLLGHLRSQRVDTLGRIKAPGESGFTVLPATRNRPSTIVATNPLTSIDQALLFPDGWIALARTNPYRVDWRAPDGQWREGAPLPFSPVEVDKGEKCAAMERFMGFTGPCDPSILPGWPETVPPFLPNRIVPPLLASPDGHLVIFRAPTAASDGELYDVVDRSGRLVGRLHLEENETLIGFGAKSAYTLATDEWDLQTLRRHPWAR